MYLPVDALTIASSKVKIARVDKCGNCYSFYSNCSILDTEGAFSNI